MTLKKILLALTVSASCLIAGVNTASAEGLVHTTSNQTTDEQITQQADAKKINLEWNVLPTVMGYVEGSIDFRVNPASAIGITGGRNTRNNDITMYNVALTYSYALNGDYMSSGWLFKPFVGYLDYEDTSTFMGSPSTIDRTGMLVGMLFTYKWLWESGLNVQLGFGPQYASVNSDSWGDDDGSEGLILAGEFGLGYSF